MDNPGKFSQGRANVSAEDCRAQLALIVASADFDATGRERRFLSHVVEETLAGRGDRIKAYSIAVEVFGRGEAFDAQTDPIVRIEAGHLRRALERYYLTSGHADPILITIPKGGYVPSFSLRSSAPVVSSDTPAASHTVAIPTNRMRTTILIWALLACVVALAFVAWWWHPRTAVASMPERPRVLVQSFDDLAGTTASKAIASGLKQEVISQLSKFKDVVVMESTANVEEILAPAPRFVLAGTVNLSDDAFRLQVRFINRSDGSVLWANSYDGAMKVAELVEVQTDIASNVATSLAQTYGVIFQADANLHVDNPPDDWVAYSCTLSFYAYRFPVDPETRSAVRTCLERSVSRFPTYATAWGLLSLVYTDDFRFEFPADSASSAAVLERALAAARRAVELDPVNIRGRQAQMLALYFNKEIDAALSVGKQTLNLNPNDTEFMGIYGERLAVSGNWHDGCSLIAAAHQRSPGASPYYEGDLALCSYFSGDYGQAAMWIKKSSALSNPIYHLIAAAAFGEGGNKIEAERERTWLIQNQPNLVKTVRRQLSIRLARAQDVDFFIGSLKKAGLEVAD